METSRKAHNGNGLGPIVDDVELRTLFDEESFETTTADGWTLVVTRYRPRQQDWNQPLWGQALLCVHGFSQNRYAWITGEFAKNMLYFGADLYFAELRGHGRSSRKLQQEKSAETGRPLPASFDYTWNIDDYFLRDLPTIIEAVKEHAGLEKIFYCGHSMGGMLGYGLCTQREDIAGLITIGSPLDLGDESLLLRIAARFGGLLPLFIAGTEGFNAARRSEYNALRSLGRALRSLPGTVNIGHMLSALENPRDLRPRVVRMDLFLRLIHRYVQVTDREGFYIPKFMRIFNPNKHISEDLEWILTEGGEKEPIAVLEQFIRWINKDEMKCYKTGYDFKDNLARAKLPIAIIFGDEDFLAGVKSTRSVYEIVKSDYIVWRPVRGNSHLEITMGSDIRQICYDIKNLMEYAIAHRDRAPRLPRKKMAG